MRICFCTHLSLTLLSLRSIEEEEWREKQRQRSSRLFGGADFIQFLAALASFALVNLEDKVEYILFFQIDRDKTASAARN